MGIFSRERQRRRRAREAAIRSFFAVFALEGTNDVTVDARRSRSNEGLFEDGEDGGARRWQKGEGEKNPYGAGGKDKRWPQGSTVIPFISASQLQLVVNHPPRTAQPFVCRTRYYLFSNSFKSHLRKNQQESRGSSCSVDRRLGTRNKTTRRRQRP